MIDISANEYPVASVPHVASEDACDPALGVGTEGFEQVTCLLRNWAALKGTRVAPLRAEIDPRPIASALSRTFIAALVAPRVARMRIAGTGLHDLMGMDVRGMPLTVFFAGAARDEVMRACAHVAQGGHVLLPLSAETGSGQAPMDGLLALLPLSTDGSHIDLVLGILETSGRVGAAPRRFRLRAPQQVSHAPPLPRTRPLLPALRDRLSGLTNPPASSANFAGTDVTAAHRRAAFRIIPGGRRG